VFSYRHVVRIIADVIAKIENRTGRTKEFEGHQVTVIVNTFKVMGSARY
jgi:hypothetical protein